MGAKFGKCETGVEENSPLAKWVCFKTKLFFSLETEAFSVLKFSCSSEG